MADREKGSAPQQHAALEPSSLDTAIQIDVQGTTEQESEPPAETATGKKQRLPNVDIGYILAMPTEKPDEYPDMPSYLCEENMAEILGVTEEWLEVQRQLYREGVLRSQRIHDHFVKFQARVRHEWLQKGYVEMDDHYFTGRAEFQEEARAMWEENMRLLDR